MQKYRLRITGNLGFEVWQDIPEYEGYYQVSTYGRVKRFYDNGKHRILKSSNKNKHSNYQFVMLSKHNEGKRFSLHKLVALTFIPNPSNLPQINHKDENKLNNKVENLEWCDAKYNCNYGTGAARNGYSQRKVKDCLRKDDREYQRNYEKEKYHKNKDRISEQRKKRYLANREAILERNRKWRINNKLNNGRIQD